MARKKKQKEQPPGAPAYMLTWGDLCTLLMTFFVLIVSMSSVSPAKFEIAASSFQNALSGVLESLPSVLITKDVMVPRMGGNEQNKRMAVDAKRRIERTVKSQNLEDAVKVHVTETGIAIKVADPVGFDVGQSAIRPEFTQLLYQIAETIKQVPETQIRVEGHTDNSPINTREFPSNWELSSSRALNIVKFLAYKCNIDPTRLSGVGYGEYRPIAPNTTPENRQKNRRIEIYVEYVQKKETT